MNTRRFLLSIGLLLALAVSAEEHRLTSPDGQSAVVVSCDSGRLTYLLQHSGHTMLQPSALGLTTNHGDYASQLTVVDAVERDTLIEYDMRKTKVRHQQRRARLLTLSVQNPAGNLMHVDFVLTDTDLAFRYRIAPCGSDHTLCLNVLGEQSSFCLPDDATTFLCPQIGPMTGWERTKPSYEEDYEADAPLTASSRYGFGYTFPCLFRLSDYGWLLVSETGVDGSYCGSHLSDYAPGRGYTIAFPHEGENNGVGSAFASVSLPCATPWRTVTFGTTLKPIAETTISYDLVAPKYTSYSWNNQPGRYTWSWLLWQDESINYDDQVRFIDLAADMGYEYTLVDNWWDQRIGRDSIAKLSRYAQSRGVGLFLWYNSNGYQNDAPQTPRNCMNTSVAREREMQWLRSIGVKGIKVDFFGGDKQATMQLYEDILSDANRYGLQVIFHGCTLPRGWERMYPNFVSSEAVLASENVMFDPRHAETEPFELTMHPFCRNAVATMDWGGTIMNRYMSRDNKSRHRRSTTNTFEIATSVTNQSSVQCVALTPNNLTDLPATELKLLRTLPTTWDETRFVDGYPGRFVVMARRRGNDWYIAGLNADASVRTATLQLPWLAGQSLSYYTDNPQTGNTVHHEVRADKRGRVKVTLQPRGGILLTTAGRADGIRVACVGNSITAGYGIADAHQNGYPARLQQLLGRDYLVRNFGVSSRTQLSRGDYPYRNEPEYLRCKQFLPNIVVLKLGTNDSKPENWQHGADYEHDLEQMVGELESLPSHPRIYLATPIPAFKPTWNISDSVIRQSIIPIIYNVARRHHLSVIDLHTLYAPYADRMLDDGIHPNAEGAATVAQFVCEELKKK